MIREINKDTRNTIAAFLLFIYGCLLLPVLLISFKSAAYGVNLIFVLGFACFLSLAVSVLFYNLKITMRFTSRIIIYWLIITGIIFFIWLIICEGTFIIKE
ncbi:MAG: hypothetical protein LC117_07795 [Bacteroidia bacterium]|nr:hypothetical protein [Bacteroidia bacterium]MCZ2277813.1 hypothetical protein [Bacteroidia bacterium]